MPCTWRPPFLNCNTQSWDYLRGLSPQFLSKVLELDAGVAPILGPTGCLQNGVLLKAPGCDTRAFWKGHWVEIESPGFFPSPGTNNLWDLSQVPSLGVHFLICQMETCLIKGWEGSWLFWGTEPESNWGRLEQWIKKTNKIKFTGKRFSIPEMGSENNCTHKEWGPAEEADAPGTKWWTFS